MRNKLLIFTALLLTLRLGAFSGEFVDKGGTIAADFPSGWTAGKSDDRTVTLRVERGRDFVEFSKQDSELGDYYLKARVKEQVDALRSKGTSLSGDVSAVSLHGKGAAYYTSYESMGAEAYIAFFTYNSASYAVSAYGMDGPEFRGMLASVRKPGEKIEFPKPRRRLVRRARREEGRGPEETAQVFAVESSSTAVEASSGILNVPAQVSTGAAVSSGPAVSAPAAPAPSAGRKFLSALASKESGEAGLPPYVRRSPLPLAFWVVLIALWIAGSAAARSAAAAYKNPKLPPPPAEVPPDFFFPFLITRYVTARDVAYQITTRQKQQLLAEYVTGYEIFISFAVYGALLFHVAWSAMALTGSAGAVPGALLGVPLIGRALASFPEALFLIPLAIGLYKYMSSKHELHLMDAQSSLVMEVKPEGDYGLIRDGAGKEVARLVKKGTFMYRYWEFVDTDNLVVFSIRDDFPKGYLMRKLFGSLGGALRSRYGIFAQDRRAGFVFLDPTSRDRFQIHMDFAFARLGHPAQILAAVLYIVSREKDPPYPSPF